MKVIKKDGTLEEFDGEKIVNAVNKSASRVMIHWMIQHFMKSLVRYWK